MNATTRPTPKYQQPVEQQVLTELQELRRAVEQIAFSVKKLADDLPHELRG
jgi:hypothetical protein